MEKLPKLKHLSRSPLSFHQIPRHLRYRIVSQQSLITACNLAFTNWECYQTVEGALSQIPCFGTVKEIFRYVKYVNDANGDRWNWDCYHALNITSETRRYAHPSQWIIEISYRSNELRSNDEELADAVTKHLAKLPSAIPIKHLWMEQQQRGPKKINLQSIIWQQKLWKKIFEKASTLAAIRLAKTRKAIAIILDSYIKAENDLQYTLEYKSAHPEDLAGKQHNQLLPLYSLHFRCRIHDDNSQFFDYDYYFYKMHNWRINREKKWVEMSKLLGYGYHPDVEYEIDGKIRTFYYYIVAYK